MSTNVKSAIPDKYHWHGREWILAVLFGLILLVLYTGLNTCFSFRFRDRDGHVNYRMLADAFLSGQVYLKEPVDPLRLNSPDPLDPSLPYPFLDDALIWNGKYYFQHEPLPALPRVLWRKLTGSHYPTGAIVVICALGSVLWLGGLLWLLRKAFFRESPVWIFWYVWAAFALSAPQLYTVARPVVFNESSAMGCFFALGAATFLVLGLTHVGRLRMSLILTGLFGGFAFLSRAQMGVYLMVLPLCLIATHPLKHTPALSSWKVTILVLFPIAGAVAGQFIYNFLRFGDPLDFGRGHIMFYEYWDYWYLNRGGNFFRIEHFPFHVYHYLLALPRITDKLGILRYSIERIVVGDVMVERELVSSIFIMVPALLLVLPFPWLFNYSESRKGLTTILLFCALAPLTVLTMLCFFVGATARYLYDFTPLLFVLIFFNLVILWGRVRGNVKLRRMIIVGLSLLFIVNFLMGLLLALTGILVQDSFFFHYELPGWIKVFQRPLL